MSASNVKKEFLVQVTIIEARHLKGKEASGTSDPFVKILCANKPPQATKCETATTHATWNQSFTFHEVMLTEVELETQELKIEVNELIGNYSIGLSTLHRNNNHEFFNMWLTLLHPDFGSESQGYLLVNAFIVGPEDQIPVHPIGEKVEINELEDEIDAIPVRKQDKGIISNIPAIGKPVLAKKGYQLSVNIYKADNLGQKDFTSVDSFVTVRCAGINLATHVVEATFAPAWNTKMLFPIFYPILNDKIVVRVWDRNKMRSDTLIATIPEIPSDNDWFNISKLQSSGGFLPARWFNLYGHPPDEVGGFINDFWKLTGALKLNYEGSKYLGRILVSLGINQNEKPEQGVTKAVPLPEPLTKQIALWVDLYDLRDIDGEGSRVWVRVSIGQHQQESVNARKKKNKEGKETNNWYWGDDNRGQKIKTISEQFPVDITQIPDIFLELYTETFMNKEVRLGYLRLKATDCEEDIGPRWRHFKAAPGNLKKGTNAGQILASVFLNQQEQGAFRMPKHRAKAQKFYFYSWIIGGYDLAPDIEDEQKLICVPYIHIGEKTVPLPESKRIKSRYPRWDWDFQTETESELQLQIGFETGLILRFTLQGEGFFSTDTDLGRFIIPLEEIQDKFHSPSFFHIVAKNNPTISQGRILAQFYLTSWENREEVKKIKALQNRNMRMCDLKIGIIGFRNLVPEYSKPKLVIKVPGFLEKDKEILQQQKYELEGKNHKHSPNFCTIVIIKDLNLPEDGVQLPILQIELHDSASWSTNMCYCLIPTHMHASWLQNKDLQVKVNNFYMQTFKGTGEVQKPYIPRTEAKNNANKQFSILESENEEEEEENAKNKIKKSEIMGESDQEEEEEGEKETKQEEPEIKPVEQIEEEGEEDIDYKAERKKKEEKWKQDINDISDPRNVKHGQIIWFDKTEGDFEQEKNLDKSIIERIQQDITEKEAEKQKQLKKKGHVTEEIFEQIKELEKRKKNLLENEDIVNEQKFQGVEEDDEEEFDYGRPVLRNETMEEKLQLPYQRFEMYKIKSGVSSKVAKVGIPNGCIMKAAILLTESEKESLEEYDKEKDITILLPKEPNECWKFDFFNHLICKPDVVKKGQEPTYTSSLLNIFRPKKKYKARLYLLRCVNLAARKNERDWAAIGGGLDSLSSTNPYPEVIIGQGEKDSKEDLKYVNEQQKYEKSTLDPDFFRNYEFDCEFPQDWKLELRIYDHVDILWDVLIGATSLDLEDRYFGNPETITKICYDSYTKAITNEKSKAESEKQIRVLESLQRSLNGWRAQVKEQELIPVEYRPLVKEDKKTQQGMAEMWVEVLEKMQAQKKQMQKIQKPEKEDFEMRFIVWEIRKFQIPEGEECISPFVRVIYDPDGWTGEMQSKETDNHNGSSDGRGVYNWRMKFKVKLPTQFPRIKIQVYNFSTFGDDQMLGQTVLDWGKYFRRLKSEGKCSVPQQYIPLTNPAEEKKLAGEICLEAKILDMHEALQKPVGESWDEPNQDPVLEKPTEGRGMLDFLKGTALDVSKLAGLFNFMWLKKLIALGGAVGIIVILFVYPGIAIKK